MPPEFLASWQKCWRRGFAPSLTISELQALRKGLAEDDQRLMQGITVAPPPMAQFRDKEPEGACAICFCGWQGSNLQTVEQVEDYFASCCELADARLGGLGTCRHLLHFVDQTPRDEMRRLLLAEVERTLSCRQAASVVVIEEDGETD